MQHILTENFVLFRSSNSENIQLWKVSTSETNSDFFTFHSFDNQREIHLFPNEKFDLKIEEISELQFNIPFKDFPKNQQAFTKKEYLDKCRFFIDALQKNDYQKLILSRIKMVTAFENLGQKFTDLCKKYPSAFVYLANFEGETWLGASPERLLQIENNQLKTVALAGTKAVSENRNWTEKEYKEHKVVVDYIASHLSDLALNISETQTINLGEIEHLKTYISAEINSETDIQKIINRLHPTPAVCGIPKEKAMQFILEHEGYDRSFYTGYFGLVSKEKTDIFVNLRCAQLFKNQIAIYVGGGLLTESNPESEWQETEWKARALVLSTF